MGKPLEKKQRDFVWGFDGVLGGFDGFLRGFDGFFLGFDGFLRGFDGFLRGFDGFLMDFCVFFAYIFVLEESLFGSVVCRVFFETRFCLAFSGVLFLKLVFLVRKLIQELTNVLVCLSFPKSFHQRKRDLATFFLLSRYLWVKNTGYPKKPGKRKNIDSATDLVPVGWDPQTSSLLNRIWLSPRGLNQSGFA